MWSNPPRRGASRCQAAWNSNLQAIYLMQYISRHAYWSTTHFFKMAKKSKTSKLSIDSDVQSNGNGKRLHMKWKSVPLWYVVFLSIFTLSHANGSPRWNKLSAASSFLKPKSSSSKSVQEMSIIPYHASLGSKKQSADKCLSSLRGGSAAVNPFPSGYVHKSCSLFWNSRSTLKLNEINFNTSFADTTHLGMD